LLNKPLEYSGSTLATTILPNAVVTYLLKFADCSKINFKLNRTLSIVIFEDYMYVAPYIVHLKQYIEKNPGQRPEY